MAEQPIQMTPAELSATTLVRVAELVEPKLEPVVINGVTVERTAQCYDVAPCPYEVGDVLFHQEEWHSIYGPDHPIANDDPYMFYRANQDDPAAEVPGMDWYPTDTMPFWASRHRRTVTSVELVRLKDEAVTGSQCRYGFAVKWDRANPDHPWASNPWVWKIGVEGGEK